MQLGRINRLLNLDLNPSYHIPPGTDNDCGEPFGSGRSEVPPVQAAAYQASDQFGFNGKANPDKQLKPET